MPFEPDDFYVGIIAFFSVNDLTFQPPVRTTNPTRDAKPRPFVCYAEEAGIAYWTCMTTTPKPHRRTVSRRWLRCPDDCTAFQSIAGDLIISDGKNAFFGPIAAFAKCSRKRDIFRGMRRPMLLPQGVAEVQSSVASRGGMMPAIRAADAA